jgi:hypothetical protein
MISACKQEKIYYNKGAGIYPGNPDEDFSPALVEENQTYRNIALLRTAYNSSSYDYNLTAQLVTDGIIADDIPVTIALSTNKDPLSRNEREWLLDHNSVTTYSLDGSEVWLQYEVTGDIEPPHIDRITLYGNDALAPRPSFPFNFRMPRPQRIVNISFIFDKPVSYRLYRISLSAPSAETWTFSEMEFYRENKMLKMVPSGNFKSAWMSAGSDEEWIYIDLGTKASFDNLKLHWIKKASEGKIQVSDNAKTWLDLTELPGSAEMLDDIKLNN